MWHFFFSISIKSIQLNVACNWNENFLLTKNQKAKQNSANEYDEHCYKEEDESQICIFYFFDLYFFVSIIPIIFCDQTISFYTFTQGF